MAASHTFRSALGGFNREDVVQYIEYTRSRHDAEIAQLKSDNQALKEELALLRARPSQENTPDLSAQLAELEEKYAAIEQERNALTAQIAQLQAELSSKEAPVAQTPNQELAGKELEAYRRAERAERVARERAQLIYDQANGVLADATVHVDEAAAQIGQMTDTVSAQLSALQEAVSSSKHALKEAAATLASICTQAADDE